MTCTCTVHVIVCLFGSSDKKTETKKAEAATAYNSGSESDESEAVSIGSILVNYTVQYLLSSCYPFLYPLLTNATVPDDEAVFLAQTTFTE